MWLTTPRFLAGVAVVTVLTALLAWCEDQGLVGHGLARGLYALVALALMAAIVFHARARWRSWTRRDA
jgi:hypothetical protein